MRIYDYASTAQAIRAPFSFFVVNDDDWSSSHNNNYWNKRFTDPTDINNVGTKKTIYDPSVSGFTLPKTAAFTSFTSSGDETEEINSFNVLGSFTKGWSFYCNGWKSGETIFFPALGCRDIYSPRGGNGIIVNVNVAGYYWTVGAASAENARFMNFYSYRVSPQNNAGRSYGFTARPILE